ncbi:hypothetical protein HELRODRAFT_129899, partial [Helobdella robusta]|uniref:non-specific serine/threonine protein kinase n=1 Tax=Helobdella robusta TaxID=6412 RepID=T1EHS7_HELRO
YRTVSLEDRCSFKKPKKLFLYCNGDQYSKVKPVHINPHKYRDFNDLLTDLTNKLPSNSKLTYGVRQIFTPVTGRKIINLTQLNDGRNIVCAGFESFKPINYGEDITTAWSNEVKTKDNDKTVHHQTDQQQQNKSFMQKTSSQTDREHSKPKDVKSGKLLIKNKMSHKIKRLEELDNRAANYNNLVGVNDYGGMGKMFGNGKKMVSLTAYKKELAEVHVKDERPVELVIESNLKTVTKINLPASNKTATISKPSTASQSVLTPASQLLTLPPPPPLTTTTATAPTGTLLKTNSKKLKKSSPIRTSNVDSANMRRQQYTTMAVHKSKQQRQISAVKRIREKYEFLEILGDGNFAVVRRARKLGHNLELAVKVIDKSKLKGKEDMLENEICLMKLCDHANIVKLFEEFETFSEIYLVMELVKGGDLFDLISLHTKFDEWTSSLMVCDLTSALYYLHSRSIVHRDMKPENILVHNRSNGSICLKLADFGLAMVVDGPLLIVCGTPTYVAPEILLEQGYGLPIDMWALGVITYILLCGFPPFRSPDRNQSELFEAIKLGVYEFLSPYWDDVSAEPRSLIEKLLVVDPAVRYSAIDVLCHPFI